MSSLVIEKILNYEYQTAECYIVLFESLTMAQSYVKSQMIRHMFNFSNLEKMSYDEVEKLYESFSKNNNLLSRFSIEEMNFLQPITILPD